MDFNICTCSSQDFAARMASVHALCAEMAYDRRHRSAAERNQALFAGHLHQAMGYRAEHLEGQW